MHGLYSPCTWGRDVTLWEMDSMLSVVWNRCTVCWSSDSMIDVCSILIGTFINSALILYMYLLIQVVAMCSSPNIGYVFVFIRCLHLSLITDPWNSGRAWFIVADTYWLPFFVCFIHWSHAALKLWRCTDYHTWMGVNSNTRIWNLEYQFCWLMPYVI